MTDLEQKMFKISLEYPVVPKKQGRYQRLLQSCQKDLEAILITPLAQRWDNINIKKDNSNQLK